MTAVRDAADFQAVIFCGHGESLYPLTEGENATPKALLPIGGGKEVLIDRVLSWVEESGISDVLVLCPPSHHMKITEHLQTSWPTSSHPSSTTTEVNRKKSTAVAKQQQASSSSSSGNAAGIRRKRQAGDATRLEIHVHGLDEREAFETYEGEKEALSHPDHAKHNSHAAAQYRTTGPASGLKSKGAGAGDRLADDDGDTDEDEQEGFVMLGGGARTAGTGRVLRRWRNHLKRDFVVLPCDISPPPALPLSHLLDRHRNQSNSLVTSLWYEKGELEIKDQDGPESVLLAYDKASKDLLMVLPLEELEDDLVLRTSLLQRYPALSLTTKLMDAHVYVFKRPALDLMMTQDPRDLDSVREDLVPWLVKGTWQTGLSDRWSKILKPDSDPLAAAFRKSLTRPSTTVHDEDEDGSDLSASFMHSANATVPSSPTRGDPLSLSGEVRRSSGRGSSLNRTGDEWKCSMVIWDLPDPSRSGMVPPATGKEKLAAATKGGSQGANAGLAKDPEQLLIRANTVAAYWELNRQYLREMPLDLSRVQRRVNGAEEPAGPAAAGSGASGVEPNIHPRAQVSPDSEIDATTRVSERSSIKKCLIGRHCIIGKNVRLTGCVIWDFAVIADGAKIDNSILCDHVRIGEKATIVNCELGSGVEVSADKS